ncbi:hypothetical protein BT96DRAFT_946747 [Gymnopus androsaceus JB14]|uniref:Uncharacterized protein n=1 Tax=Gymnopus androsaceus JB14 TaxID=1447944 RepID=A0A6A4GX09_9AGAR|nr:hypothetical protein BT96DRAFT_946747 [Gymnopus androsaceus JB14]
MTRRLPFEPADKTLTLPGESGVSITLDINSKTNQRKSELKHPVCKLQQVSTKDVEAWMDRVKAAELAPAGPGSLLSQAQQPTFLHPSHPLIQENLSQFTSLLEDDWNFQSCPEISGVRIPAHYWRDIFLKSSQWKISRNRTQWYFWRDLITALHKDGDSIDKTCTRYTDTTGRFLGLKAIVQGLRREQSVAEEDHLVCFEQKATPKNPVIKQMQKRKNTPGNVEKWLQQVDSCRKSEGFVAPESLSGWSSSHHLESRLEYVKDITDLLEASVRQNAQIIAFLASTSLPSVVQAPPPFMIAQARTTPGVHRMFHAGNTAPEIGETIFSLTQFFSLEIANGQIISYSSDDLPDNCDCLWPTVGPKQDMRNLQTVWDDEDPHWMNNKSVLIPLMIGGKCIALRYWRKMWNATGKRFPSKLLTSWHNRKYLTEELRKYPSVQHFLAAFIQTTGRPGTITQIIKAVRNKRCNEARVD